MQILHASMKVRDAQQKPTFFVGSKPLDLRSRNALISWLAWMIKKVLLEIEQEGVQMLSSWIKMQSRAVPLALKEQHFCNRLTGITSLTKIRSAGSQHFSSTTKNHGAVIGRPLCRHFVMLESSAHVLCLQHRLLHLLLFPLLHLHQCLLLHLHQCLLLSQDQGVTASLQAVRQTVETSLCRARSASGVQTGPCAGIQMMLALPAPSQSKSEAMQ